MQAANLRNLHVIKALSSNRSDQSLEMGVGMSIQLRRMATLKFDVSE
jgi:hypothetical protein